MCWAYPCRGQSSTKARRLVVISDSFWRAHYASANAIGKTLKISGTIYTIAGIADERFRGDWILPVDVWFPRSGRAARKRSRDPKWTWLGVIARRAPETANPQVKAEVNALEHQYLEDRASTRHFNYPRELSNFLGQWIELEPGATRLSYSARQYFRPLIVISSIAGMVLLIACANLAN